MLELTYHNNLIIGLGGTGGRVLKELKKLSSGNLFKNCGIEFLYIDSASDYSRDFDCQEFYNISTDIRKTADYNGILTSKFDSGQTDSSVIWNNLKPIAEGCHWMEYWLGGQGAKQNRRAGRMMFGAHLMDIDRCLYNRIHKLYDSTGVSPDIDLNVFIISHLSGGTGSGSLIDMIMLIKSYHRNAQINIIGVLPTVPSPVGHDAGRYLANAYATLMELTALNKGNYTPIDLTSGVRQKRPFLGDSQKKLFSTLLFNTEQVADTLYHLLTLTDSNQTLPFVKEIEGQPFASLGFSKINHPLEEFERNFSYDGSAERAIWRALYRDAECKLIVEKADYMRLVCVPYSLDEKKSHVNAVKFMNNILWNNPNLLIDNSKNNRDEIAMLSLCCGFQLHNISIMPELKKQYDQLMSADKAKALSMLHIENEFSELPSLLNDKNEERKYPYIFLAMAMKVLCQDWDLEGNKIWAYKTIGYLPDGTPARGTFYNRLTWLDPTHEFIFEHEMPTHLFKYIKRDVDNLIEKNKDNAEWIEKTLKSIDVVASKFERTIGATEAEKSKIEASNILKVVSAD